jgi:hypothetical protein
MRIVIPVFAVLLLFAPAGGGTQDSAQLYYALQSLQSEVRSLQNRVQQLESGQHIPRPREDTGATDAIQRQLSRLEDRMNLLESRLAPPKPLPPKETRKN